MNDTLLDSLMKAEAENPHLGHQCGACVAILAHEPGATQDALRAALGGTIGREKLVKVLKTHGINVSARQIVRHRTEGHQ